MAASEEFIRWLTEEMDKRGWNNSELARKAGLRSPSTIQQVVTGGRNPGVEFCLGVARAFREPPELVFRRAGLLPDREGIEDELYDRFRAYIEELSPERRAELFRYVMFLHQMEQEKEAKAK
jgi:transcriptional regulator with XRE-family HTH domain